MIQLKNKLNPHNLTILAFSFLFAYLLSFVFEGQVLYSLIAHFEAKAETYILPAMVAHFLGLISCGFFIKTLSQAKHITLGMLTCIIATAPFYFKPSALWLISIIFVGFISGCAVAAWGHFLKAFVPKGRRLQACADMLIYSNLIMIAINVVAMNFHHLQVLV